ncbi:hypothetical protein CDEST_12411 [Colletotrichum destructivum]|uniref:Uncharacterized protein n=1 Tax=Colletotrichum destructivum TaxID=34406 RepID=A0AAX4IVY9_9PEZI|nr:hypothetical protein CDEST_12411 [Colletotrichum destructivum]
MKSTTQNCSHSASARAPGTVDLAPWVDPPSAYFHLDHSMPRPPGGVSWDPSRIVLQAID